MTGGLLQLSFYGAQNIYLNGNPQMSHFVTVFRRATFFAIECNQQYFTAGDINFGKKCYCQLDKVGDLVTNIYLRIKLPSLEQYAYINSTNAGNELVSYYWCNYVALALIESISIEIGGQVIDTHYGVYLKPY